MAKKKKIDPKDLKSVTGGVAPTSATSPSPTAAPGPAPTASPSPAPTATPSPSPSTSTTQQRPGKPPKGSGGYKKK